MGLFNNIMSKIFGHAETPAPKTAGTFGGTDVAVAGGVQTLPQVDVAAILEGMAAKNPEKLDWRQIIIVQSIAIINEPASSGSAFL